MKKIIHFTLSVFALFSTETYSSTHTFDDSDMAELNKDSLYFPQTQACFSGQNYTTGQLEKITQLFYSSAEREIPSKNSPEGRDFGYDFPKSLASDFITLLTIKNLSVDPPICYDLGGGFGGASLNMVLAGGRVTYIEQHPDVAAQARKEVYGALKDISRDSKQKEEFWGRLRMVRWNFLDTDHKMLYPKDVQVNFFNLSNVLHFLTPSQMETFLPALLTKMAPNGLVFASMHVPCESKKVIDFFLEQKEKGNPYPGYFRYIRHCDLENVTGENPNCVKENKALNEAEPALEGDLPGTKISQTLDPMPPHKPKTLTVKSVIHYFDPDIATSAFKRAGYTVRTACFMSQYGEPQEDIKATKEAFLKGNYHMMIIATKP